MYEDLTESFLYIVGDLFDYGEKNKVDLPNRNRIYRNIEKAKQLIEYHMSRTSEIIPSHSSTESQQRNKTTDDSTEPIFTNKLRKYGRISDIVSGLNYIPININIQTALLPSVYFLNKSF